ncbi:hypothetical protein LCI18_006481 [Fusarium solani-melongenae]|uniref:Uncharacterized protein n=1 Tax=Fusarium solani subsp. cucurbitae TaxID=2747967 RepID=A0ACD3Z2X8_FUSSC|nr:hypothetical protein LCI18_006481 [Fusarium solani-melongenae]
MCLHSFHVVSRLLGFCLTDISFIMSDMSIRETIEFDEVTPGLTEHLDDAIDAGNDHTPSPGYDGNDSLGEDFDHADSTSPSPSDEANESLPAESDSRTLVDENHGSPSPKTSRLSQLFANFADEFLDIVEEDAQEAVIAVTKAESEKVRGEMKGLKRSIDKRDQSHIAFQSDVSDRFASLEQGIVDRILLLEKITNSRMTRLEKSINARFASLEQSMNDRFAELEERID